MRRPSLQSAEGAGITMAAKPKLLERALSVLRGNRSPPPSSVLSSAVGFYAAHATILAATVVGTSLGLKVTKVAEKVATDTAEDLRKAAGSFEGGIPDLVWLREPEAPPRPLTPVITVQEPTPPPSPVPSLQIEYEPLERRMRKARAQMDMSKSVGYRAVEELLKAQSTHTTLQRQFEEARVTEMNHTHREAFAAEEVKEKEAADTILRKLNGRIKHADNESQQVHESLDQELAAARAENEKMQQLMGEMGVSPRPTVAQWLQQKQQQRKRDMEEALISWDRSKPQRETAILVEQMLTSQRAMRHAAWGASKDISSRIRALKKDELLGAGSATHYPQKIAGVTSRRLFPRRPEKSQSPGKLQGPPPLPRSRTKRPLIIPVREKKMLQTKSVGSGESSVRATPHGFLKIRENNTTSSSTSPRQQQPSGGGAQQIWSYAQDPSASPQRRATVAYFRAIGPKTVHAPRTLRFLPPQQYHEVLRGRERERERERERRASENEGRFKRSSFLGRESLVFGGREMKKERRASIGNTSTARYHSLADGLSGRGQLPRKRAASMEVPVLPMTVLRSRVTPPTVNC